MGRPSPARETWRHIPPSSARRTGTRSLRIASAVIVILTVAKVFLIDMANLEGVLRALSFIGLGFVLIGIGLFYQKILSGKSARSPAVDEDEAPTGI